MSIQRWSITPFKLIPIFEHASAFIETEDEGGVECTIKRLKFFRWLCFAYCYSSDSEIGG